MYRKRTIFNDGFIIKWNKYKSHKIFIQSDRLDLVSFQEWTSERALTSSYAVNSYLHISSYIQKEMGPKRRIINKMLILHHQQYIAQEDFKDIEVNIIYPLCYHLYNKYYIKKDILASKLTLCPFNDI